MWLLWKGVKRDAFLLIFTSLRGLLVIFHHNKPSSFIKKQFSRKCPLSTIKLALYIAFDRLYEWSCLHLINN